MKKETKVGKKMPTCKEEGCIHEAYYSDMCRECYERTQNRQLRGFIKHIDPELSCVLGTPAYHRKSPKYRKRSKNA